RQELLLLPSPPRGLGRRPRSSRQELRPAPRLERPPDRGGARGRVVRLLMRVKFWGVRGSVSSPGRSTLGVGGNTPCIEVRTATNALVVLDAGIGLCWLGRSLLAGPHGRGQGETTILLSRTHWDHIQGIPFFVPAFLPGNKTHIYGAALSGRARS